MAVDVVTESGDKSGELNITIGRQGSVSYIVQCTSELDDSTNIEQHPKIPKLGDPHPKHSEAHVVSIRSQRNEDTCRPWVWDTTVTYEQSKNTDTPGDPAPIEELIAQPPEFSVSHTCGEYYSHRDYDGELIDDTAGTLFADPPPLLYPIYHWTFRRYEWMNDAIWANAAAKANSTPWFGKPAYSCKIESINTTQHFLDGWNFHQVTYEIIGRNFSAGPLQVMWYPAWVINAGPLSLGTWTSGDGTEHPGGQKKHVVDSTGMPTSEPQYLDRDGYQMEYDPDVDPIFLDFKTIQFFDFNELGLVIPPPEWGGHGR